MNTTSDVSGDLFGLTVNDLQENVVVSDDAITGTLKHVTDYTGFSSKIAEQDGNYLAIKCEADDPTATITVELVGGTKGPVVLDEDGIIVLRIADKDAQTIRVVGHATGAEDFEQTFSLSGLVLETE